ncbi:MAG: hypothetical protein AAGD22_01090 [Verrucomicrobiota bacterium]
MKIDAGKKIDGDRLARLVSAFGWTLPVAEEAGADSIGLFVEESGEEMELRVLELEAIAAFGDSSFSENDGLFTAGERFADQLPFFKAGGLIVGGFEHYEIQDTNGMRHGKGPKRPVFTGKTDSFPLDSHPPLELEL